MSEDIKVQQQIAAAYPQIRRVVSRISHDHQEWDDLTQECCARLIEKEGLWRESKGSFRAWVNSVVRNLALDHLRRKRGRKMVSLEEQELIAPPEERDFSEEQIRWVLQQFNHLSDGQRQVLQMKYVEGKSVTEIAQELGITKSAVSQRVNTGIKSLQKRAKAEGFLAFLLPWRWDEITWMKSHPWLSVSCLGLVAGSWVLWSGDLSDRGSKDLNQSALSEIPPSSMRQDSNSGMVEAHEQDDQHPESPKLQKQKENKKYPYRSGFPSYDTDLFSFQKMPDQIKKHFDDGQYEEARRLCEEALGSVPDFEGDWSAGNVIHDANMTLGRIALRQGDLVSAKFYLLEASQCGESPQLKAFGPNMSLAKELLEKNEKLAVLNYLDACHSFWGLGKEILEEWKQDIENGRKPNFGPNLRY